MERMGMEIAMLRVSASTFRLRVLGLWERALRLSRRAPKRLRLCESLPLGERRFVAVVEFDSARFLVGGTPSSLVLLSRLADTGEHVEGNSDPEPSKVGNLGVLSPRRRQAEIC
jgi:flagellar biogenesis protein FliO